jgi:protein-disulfide isomerase
MNRPIKTTTLVLAALALVFATSVLNEVRQMRQLRTKHVPLEPAAASPAAASPAEEAILNELRAIRRLLKEREAPVAPPPMVVSPLPTRLRMSVDTDWKALGRAEAPVTVVEFTDYQCPFCKQFHTTTFVDLKRDYIDPGLVRWVNRDLPLEMHPYARRAAEAARCAGDQGKYWEMRDALLSSDAPPSDEVVEQSSERLLLDLPKLKVCIDSGKYRTEVRKDVAAATTLEITHTPTFVIAVSAQNRLEGVVILGAQPYAAFQAAIDTLLRRQP